MRSLVRLFAAACCVIAVFGAGPAYAQKRVALVIGNSAYQHTRALPNPRNDAEAIANLLRDNGFAEVTVKSDLDYRAMREVVRLFGDSARAADVALVYYAGHGLEVAGENYLVPVDAKLLRDFDLDYEAVALGLVLKAVDGARKLKVVVLDACRNNPLGDRMALRAGRTRTVARGLGRLDATGEVLVAYAAKAGTLAQDGAGRHSPYAEALLRHMTTPGLDVIRMFGRVKDAVLEVTNRGQEPWIYGSPGGDAVALVPAKVAEAPTPTTPVSEAERAWATAKDSTSIAVLEAFVRRFGDTYYGDLAKARLTELKQAALAVSPPIAPVPSHPSACKGLSGDTCKASPDCRWVSPAQEGRPGQLSYCRARPASGPAEPVVGTPLSSQTARSLTPAEERALKPGDSFRECNECPEMVVVPAGSFMMGSPPGEAGHDPSEGPQHRVTIATPFAVGKFEVTFAEWDACVAADGCKLRPNDQGWGRGRTPAINVPWNDITIVYLPWLSRKVGKTYRLLTEAEWEYAARAGSTTMRYGFGDAITKAQAQYFASRPVEVGSFAANRFGLHDMHGNVSEWVQDCWNGSYDGARSDGSGWNKSGECRNRARRGGSWSDPPEALRSAARGANSSVFRGSNLGFRVARRLTP